jgi:hypothetical protein
MKSRATLIVLLLVSPFQLSNGQSSSPDEIPFTEHSRALQFQIASNFTLSSFQGATISYKYHLDPLTAVRVGLSLSFSSANQDENLNSYAADTLSDGSHNTLDQTGIGIQINAQQIWYQKNSTGILFFFGTGPVIGFNRTSNNGQQIPSPVTGSQQTYKTDGTGTTWSLGMTGVAGVEWFASKTISLHAEYGLTFGYYWAKNESSSTFPGSGNKSSSSATSTIWKLSSTGVRFGMSVYF